MRERGEINIAIANYLENKFNDYTNLNKNDGNKVQCLDEIKHIIIGRWYYGLYLIAKAKLIVPASDFIKHKGNNCIWRRINKNPKNNNNYIYNFSKNGERFATLREKYEYTNIKVTNKDFNAAKKIYKDMYNGLQKL